MNKDQGEGTLSLNAVSLSYRTEGNELLDVLKDITFTVSKGEFVSVVGPSGCGKSSILDVITGTLDYSGAATVVTGTVNVSRGNDAKPLGYVFQKDTLLPWRTLFDNVKFGLQVQGASHSDQVDMANDFIKRVGLSGFERHYPHQLSGGMRQRANLIRTLAYDPDIVLMDEPFGALDAYTRMTLQQQLIDLWQGTDKTILFVTHDIEEAIILSNKVILLSPRPTTIKNIYAIDIPYPRCIAKLKLERSYHDVYNVIWEAFCQDIGLL